MSDQEDDDLNVLVDIAIENGTAKECVTSLDKVNTLEDISIYVIFLVFLIINIVVGYFAPPYKQTLNKNVNVSATDESRPVYSIIINGLQTKNSWIRVKARYIRKPDDLNKIAVPMQINTSVKYNNAKSDHSKHSTGFLNTIFTANLNQTYTDWHQIYYERVVDFDGVTAEAMISGGNEEFFSEFQMLAEFGSNSDFLIQSSTRVFYTVVLLVIIRYFNERLKVADSRHEQTLTQGILFSTVFFDNVTLLVNYVTPQLVIFIFDDIMKAFYCGYLVMFILILVGRLGSKDPFTFDFISSQVSFAGAFGLTTLGRELLIDLAEIFNPMLGVEHVDKYLRMILYILLAYFAFRIFSELRRGFKRIDESEKFRSIIYVFISCASVFIIAAMQGLICSYNSVIYMALIGTANVLAILMAYANFPLTIKETISYQETDIDSKPLEEFNNELMDSDGKLDVEDIEIIEDIDGTEKDKKEQNKEEESDEEEEVVIIEVEEEEEEEEENKEPKKAE